MLKREPIRYEDILQSFISQTGLNEVYFLYEITNNWENWFGDNLNKYCSPKRLKDSILTVKVNSSVWRSEIKIREEKIIQTINEKLNKTIVKELKIQ